MKLEATKVTGEQVQREVDNWRKEMYQKQKEGEFDIKADDVRKSFLSVLK